MVTKDMENVKEFNASFALVFVGKTYLQESQAPKSDGKVKQGKSVLLEEDQDREHSQVHGF